MATRAPALRSFSGGRFRSPLSLTQVDLVIARSVAVFGLVFGAQTVPALIDSFDDADVRWSVVMATGVFASILTAFALSFLRRGVRPAHGVVAIVYVIALITWPFAITDASTLDADRHWLYFLVNVATASAAVAASTRIATAYLLIVSAAYAIVRLTSTGGSASWDAALIETAYSLILGGAILIVVTLLRNAASSVDAAQAAALDRYSTAVRQHATEVERVQVDSIVHDSVLTTFLSAARARTPEAMALAAQMARDAVGHLQDAALVAPDDGSTVELALVARRIREAAEGMRTPFELRLRRIAPMTVPAQAAEALYASAVQAMINSVQHAGSAGHVARWLSIRGTSPTGIEVEIGDTGAGFTFVDVPAERLGLRVSIIERVANAGGIAEVDAVVGEGTVITIRWPRPEIALPSVLAAGREEADS